MMESSNDDCYFYYYSSCTKGDTCPFRHCEQALGTETVCSLWKEGRCFRANCKFRHMESKVNRSAIPCYWENQPSGCRKPHCVFFHKKARGSIQEVKPKAGLILPISDGKSSPNLPDLLEQPFSKPVISPIVRDRADDLGEVLIPEGSIPVPPLVLSLDEAEESDSESVTSTPVKTSSNNAGTESSSARTNLSAKLSGDNYGIKTLEQIRMEKIHKESDSYYSYDDTPIVEAADSFDAQIKKEYYPPKSEFISLTDDSNDKSLHISGRENQYGLKKESDLRRRLALKRSAPVLDTVVPLPKRAPNFKAEKKEADSSSFNFKVKTLAEIRKEKESKQANTLQAEKPLSMNSIPNKNKTIKSVEEIQTQQMKILRQSLKIPSNQSDHNQTSIEKENSQSRKIFLPRKRSVETAVDPVIKSKLLKLDATIKNNTNLDNATNGSLSANKDMNKNVIKNLGPFLRRPRVTSTPLTKTTNSSRPVEISPLPVISSNSIAEDSYNAVKITKVDNSQSLKTKDLPPQSTKAALSNTLSQALETSSHKKENYKQPSPDEGGIDSSVDTHSTALKNDDTHSPAHGNDTAVDIHSPAHGNDTTVDTHSPAHGNDTAVDTHSPAHGNDTAVDTHSPARDTTSLKDANDSIQDPSKPDVARSTSVDELESLLNDTDVDASELYETAEGDDLLLEIEQFLDS